MTRLAALCLAAAEAVECVPFLITHGWPGHFAAFEQPRLLVDDVRAFFRGIRDLP